MHTNEDDNPITKLRALMLKSVSGKRDLGQCEVSRLLMSEPLYSSSFEYITLSLEFKLTREINTSIGAVNSDKPATIDTLLDCFANRMNNKKLENILIEIPNFYTFAKKFKIFKGKLTIYSIKII